MSERGGAQAPVDTRRAAGEHRVSHAALFDEEIRPHSERFRAAADVGAGDRVLDIGCGTGESTRDAARAAGSGSVLGVDISLPSLELARRISDREGLANAAYLWADAQTHRFPPGYFDLCISRFGVMFFADLAAAFTSIGRSLRPGGRLVLLVWQGRDRNEWSTAVRQSLAAEPGTGTGTAGGQDPFSLGDPAVTEQILTVAGFSEVSFTEVREPVYYGPDSATACELILGLREPRELLARMAAAGRERALGRLREIVAAHEGGSGVFFDSRAWIVTARRGLTKPRVACPT